MKSGGGGRRHRSKLSPPLGREKGGRKKKKKKKGSRQKMGESRGGGEGRERGGEKNHPTVDGLLLTSVPPPRLYRYLVLFFLPGPTPKEKLFCSLPRSPHSTVHLVFTRVFQLLNGKKCTWQLDCAEYLRSKIFLTDSIIALFAMPRKIEKKQSRGNQRHCAAWFFVLTMHNHNTVCSGLDFSRQRIEKAISPSCTKESAKGKHQNPSSK